MGRRYFRFKKKPSLKAWISIFADTSRPHLLISCDHDCYDFLSLKVFVLDFDENQN